MRGKGSLLHILDPEVVKRLIKEGADVNVEDDSGYSALHGACFCGKIKIVEMLINAGALIDVKDIDGVTPLMCAAENGHAVTVRLLIRKGASITAINFFGGSAYTRACSRGHQSVISVLAEGMFNQSLLTPLEEFSSHNQKKYSLTKYMTPRRNEPALWILTNYKKPDFTRIYAFVEQDRESSCFITEKFDGSRWYTHIKDDNVVEKVIE